MLPLSTGQTPGASLASPRGGQPGHTAARAPETPGTLQRREPAPLTPEATERIQRTRSPGLKGNSSLHGTLSQPLSCLPPPTKDAGGHDC